MSLFDQKRKNQQIPCQAGLSRGLSTPFPGAYILIPRNPRDLGPSSTGMECPDGEVLLNAQWLQHLRVGVPLEAAVRTPIFLLASAKHGGPVQPGRRDRKGCSTSPSWGYYHLCNQRGP